MIEPQRDWLRVGTYPVREIGIEPEEIEYAWEPYAFVESKEEGEPQNQQWVIYDRLVVAQIEAFDDEGPFYLNVLGHRHGGMSSLEAARYMAYAHLAEHLAIYKNPLLHRQYDPPAWVRR